MHCIEGGAEISEEKLSGAALGRAIVLALLWASFLSTYQTKPRGDGPSQRDFVFYACIAYAEDL